MIQALYRDPRYMILILSLIIVSGIAGFTTRPKLEDPASQVRWGYITTYYPGASPPEVESQISEPIEKALREAKAIRAIESSSLRGVSIVFVRLTDEVVDVATSWSKIQDKLSEVSESLPDRASIPTLVDERRWEAYTTVVALVDTSERTLKPAVLARWAKSLENRLRFVQGTRFTEIFGLPEEEVLVELSEESIASTGLTMSDIANRIKERDSQTADAMSRTHQFDIPVRLAGDVDDIDRLRNVVIKGSDGATPMRLMDVAEVHRSEKFPATSQSFVDSQRAVVIGTRMDADYVIDSWTIEHMAALDDFKKSLPTGLSLKVLFSQKKYTDERSTNLYGSLGVGMLLVIAVVWLMMGWRATIPICTAIPLTLLGVFFLMIPFDVSLHQMSIAGLILALGMLVDNPIIMTDDIQRRMEAGDRSEVAITEAVKHLLTPLIGSNATTMLGFLPILLIPGPTGEYLGQLAWSVIASLFVSVVLSLTIVPVVAAWCLRSSGPLSVTPASRRGWYTKLLSWAFHRPVSLICLSLILPVLGFVVSGDLKEQFFPAAERDHFHFSVRLPTYSSIQETERVAKEACDIVRAHEEVESISLFVGTNAPMIHYSMITSDENRPDFAQAVVQLNSGQVDRRLIRDIQQELDEAFPQAQSIVTLMEQGTPPVAPIEFRIYGPSLEQLAILGEQARNVMMTVPGIIQTRSLLDAGGPEFGIQLRQHDAESTTMNDEMLAMQMRDMLDGVSLVTMSEEIEEIPIRVRVKDGHVSSPERVLSLPVLSPQRQIVPVGSIADWSIESQLFNVPHRNSSRCNIVYGYAAAGELPIVLEQQFKSALDSDGFALPLGFRSDFGGISQERDSALGNLFAFAAAICVLMVSVLVLTFRSFRQAGIILIVAILSIGLGLLSLWLFGFPIGIVAIIGLLGMMGLAINDSIVVLIDAKESKLRGESLAVSVSHSTRHILTTSLTTVAGVLPLILAGGDFWPPMMIVIAGGVVGATLLALAFTPAAFLIIRRVDPRS